MLQEAVDMFKEKHQYITQEMFSDLFLAGRDLLSADNLCKQFGPRSGPT